MNIQFFCSNKNLEKILKKYVCDVVIEVGSETESFTLLTSISSCDEDFMSPNMSPAMTTHSKNSVKKRIKKKLLPPFTKTCNKNRVSARAAVMLITSLL